MTRSARRPFIATRRLVRSRPLRRAGAALGVVLLVALGSCERRGPAPDRFDCEELQKRAERCEAEILGVVRRAYEVERVTAGTSPQKAEQAFMMFKVRFQKRLRQRALERECRDLSFPRDQAGRKRSSALRYCFSRPTCRAFGECLLSQ